MTDTDRRKITGVDAATVLVDEKLGSRVNRIAVTVRRGQRLPANMADGEVERLAKLGVFDDDTHAQRRREFQRKRRAARAAAAAQTAAATDASVADRPNEAGPGAPPPPADADTLTNPAGALVDRDDVTADEGAGPTGDPLDDPVSYLEDVGNVNRTIEFIASRPVDEREMWIDAERRGKDRAGVTDYDFDAE
jgi:hypothetical protein